MTPQGEQRCSVIGAPGDCDLLDLTVLRSDADPLLEPGIAQSCRLDF